MTIEAVPVGQMCNLKCTYCYENEMRDAGNVGGLYDIDAMIQALDKHGQQFTVFGGEPLLMKFEDLEKLLNYGFRKYGANGIQTNGSLITERHIQLFKRTNTYVGISIDGPGDLNSARRGQSDSDTDSLTKSTERNIKLLLDAKVDVALIITMHRHNGSASKLPRFKEWLRELDSIGVHHARLHLLEAHHDRSIELSEQETIDAYLDLAKFEMRELKNLRFDKFQEMLTLLSSDGQAVSCVWQDCDPYTTNAVQGVNGDGSSSNCGRTNKDGVDWIKADQVSHIRQLALYHTPQDSMGCRACRFFLVCRGYCPGTAEAQDWRNRTEHCGVIKALYGHFEEVLLDARKIPISLHPDRLKMEAILLQQLGNKTSSSNQAHEDWHINQGQYTVKVDVRR